jgi:MinD-like ATPase involved in chromosome partitioning or flagellar assembly
VPQAVNRGVPVVLDRPRSAAALALRSLADTFSSAKPQLVQTEEVAPEPESRRRWRSNR